MWKRAKIPLAVLLLLAAVVYLIPKIALSRQWLELHAHRFWESLRDVRMSYVFLGGTLIFCSYFFRSLRWREFLGRGKKGRLWNIFEATMIGFSAVALVGRPGELVRPFLIAKKENLALSSQLGAWTVERLFDGITIGILMASALLFFPPAVGQSATSARVMTYLGRGGIVFCGGGLVVAALLAQLHGRIQVVIKIIRWLSRPLPDRYRNWLERTAIGMAESFAAGLASIGNIYSFLICVAFSLLVWIPVALTYWAVTRAFGVPMSNLGPGALVLMMAVSVTGSIVQIPGIGGGPQIAVILVLTKLFGIAFEPATTAAMLLWVLGFMIVLIPGLPLAAHEGFSWRRIRALTTSDVSSAPVPRP